MHYAALLFSYITYSFVCHIYSCVTFVYVLHLFMRRILSTSSSFASHTCIHAFILSLTKVMYQLYGIAPSPRFWFSLQVSITRHYISCPVLLLFIYHIHGLMPPSLFLLLVIYQLERSAPHPGDMSRYVYDTQLPHSFLLFSLVHIA